MENVQVSACNGGAAAARDINNTHMTVVQFALLPPPSEEKLQHEFAQLTGIHDCPKEARAWLQQLMEHHGFTARELAVSWWAKSIGWDKQRNTPCINTPRLEAFFAYGVVAIVGLFCLLVAAALIWGDGNHWQMLAVYGFCAIYLGVCWMANRFMLWPRRVALRVRRAEGIPHD